MDDLYGQRKKLETIFYFFDTNGDGVISAEEFRNGCALLNKSLHPDCQLKNIDRMLQLMDFDGSGSIDINEFFEVSSSVTFPLSRLASSDPLLFFLSLTLSLYHPLFFLFSCFRRHSGY